jgi:hypothetical protein
MSWGSPFMRRWFWLCASPFRYNIYQPFFSTGVPMSLLKRDVGERWRKLGIILTDASLKLAWSNTSFQMPVNITEQQRLRTLLKSTRSCSLLFLNTNILDWLDYVRCCVLILVSGPSLILIMICVVRLRHHNPGALLIRALEIVSLLKIATNL